MTEVERLCDDAIIMRAGRVFAQGAPERLIARRGCRDLEQLFLDIVRRGEALPGASAAWAASRQALRQAPWPAS